MISGVDITDLEPLAVEGYRPELVFLTAIAVAVVAGGVGLAMALPLFDPVALVSWAVILFFGACAIGGVRSLLISRKVVLTMTPEGLRDLRISDQVIPWNEIQAISTWSFRGQPTMILKIRAEFIAKLALRPLMRTTRYTHRMLGFDGLPVPASGLKISHNVMMACAIAFTERYGNGQV
jgi:hypothetical protein